jgi:hypothetical protein
MAHSHGKPKIPASANLVKVLTCCGPREDADKGKVKPLHLSCPQKTIFHFAAGVHFGPAPQDAGQLQLVLRKQHTHTRQRIIQVDLPSLSRVQRALHGQRLQCV